MGQSLGIQCRVIGLFTAVVLSTAPAVGQRVVTIGDAATSHMAKTVSATRVVSMGEFDESDSYNQSPFSIVRQPGGRFLVVTYNGHILQYSPAGLLIHEIGRHGDGPGEFKFPRLALPADSSVYIIDDISSRMTNIGALGNVIGAHPFALRSAYAIVSASPGKWFASGSVRSPTSVGYPLHLISDTGIVERSFGPKGDQVVYRADRPENLNRVLAVSSDEVLYAGIPTSYRVEEYSRAGEIRRVFVRDSRWFHNTGVYVPPTPDIPPAAQLQAIFVDGSRQLWTASLIPSRTWGDGLGKLFSDPTTGKARYEISSISLLYDTQVEVIDLVSGKLTASTRLPGFGLRFLQNGDLTFFHQREDGVGSVVVMSLRLMRTAN